MSRKTLLITLTLFALALAACSPAPAAAPAAATQSLLLNTAAAPAATVAGGAQPPASTGKQWASAPPMTIDPKKIYVATFKLVKGDIKVQLFADKAPITVNSFVFLAKQGFFNGTTFHRVLEGFMAQGGDPTGTGMGGPGYEFVNEKNNLAFDKAGVVAMANSGPDTNGSQFFITLGPAQQLNNEYTVFGQVISGMDALSQLTPRDPTTGDPLPEPDMLINVIIEEK